MKFGNTFRLNSSVLEERGARTSRDHNEIPNFDKFPPQSKPDSSSSVKIS